MKEDTPKGKIINQKEPSLFKFDENAKNRQLEDYHENDEGRFLATDQGVKVEDIDNSLKKIIPEESTIEEGRKKELNRNSDNFFAEQSRLLLTPTRW